MDDHPGEKILELTKRAFEPGGALQQTLREIDRPYTYQDEQAEYAANVARACMAQTSSAICKVSLLEAEPGIGKTLAYLIPIALCAATGLGRGVISTFTRQLQGQIVTEDMLIAADVVRKLTGKIVTAAPRYGMRNFISGSRIETLREELQKAQRLTDDFDKILSSLLWQPDGLIRSWTEEHGPLPAGISEANICLLSRHGKDAEAYIAHIKDVASADIAVINHATLALNLLCGNALLNAMTPEGSLPYRFGVIDEAETFRVAAESVISVRVSIPMLRSAIEGITKPLKTLKMSINRTDDWFSAVFEEEARHIRKDDQGNILSLWTDDQTHTREEAAQQAEKLSIDLASAAENASDPDSKAELLSLSADLRRFFDACARESKDSVGALTWSPVRSYPGFQLIPIDAGRLMARMWRDRPAGSYLGAIICTSATLDAPFGGRAFAEFKKEIGLFQSKDPAEDHYSPDTSGTYSPRKFGSPTFVLPDPRVPCPSMLRPGADDDDEDGLPTHISNPVWIGYVVDVLKEIAKKKERALVLANSFRDGEEFANRMREAGAHVIEHRGRRLEDCVIEYVATPGSMIITPSGWAGLNLPGLVENLVITRIPFGTPESASAMVVRDVLTRRGWMPGEITRFIKTRARINAARKLKQGFGRGIRAEGDAPRVWILDSRFPIPAEVLAREGLTQSGRIASGFDLCVPERFRLGMRAPFLRATIFRCSVPEADAAD